VSVSHFVRTQVTPCCEWRQWPLGDDLIKSVSSLDEQRWACGVCLWVMDMGTGDTATGGQTRDSGDGRREREEALEMARSECIFTRCRRIVCSGGAIRCFIRVIPSALRLDRRTMKWQWRLTKALYSSS
jgi:hypothetical protein